MEKFYFTLMLATACTYIMAQQPTVATFEDLNAAPDTYWDGSDESAMFVSGGYTFINNYVDWGGYGSWDGFAYSAMTSKSYASLSDQYNSCTGCGLEGSATFAVGYYSAYMGTEPTVIANDGMPFVATGCYVTNAAYAYTSMLEGDAYSKKFDENDWFVLTATGYLNGDAIGSTDFYLAGNGSILDSWSYFDLSVLGTVDEIHFTLNSSDIGDWGMNTPSYFCLDNFGYDLGSTIAIRSIHNQSSAEFHDIHGRTLSESKGFVIKSGKVSFLK